MGGFIKVTIKENNKIVTAELHTAFFSGRYGAMNDLYKNITQDDLIKDSECFDGDEMDDLEPTSYGHLFIDRDNKKIFNMNDFCDISCSGFSFIKNRMEEYEENETPELGEYDPRFIHTDNAFIYNLKNSIDSSDNVFFVLYENGKDNILKESVEKDPLLLAQEFLDFSNKQENKRCMSIHFYSNYWSVKNCSMNEQSIKEFKDFLKNINLSY